MANNKYDKVYLSKNQLETIANGGTITSGSDTYTADETAMYLIDETIDATPTQNSTNAVESGGVYTALSGKEDVSNKVNNISSSSTDTQYPSAKCVYDNINAIDVLIPNDATSANQLADKSFVNSSISTNTANFIGTFANITALNSYSGTVTNNDYAFVVNSVVSTDFVDTTALNAYDKTLLTNFDYAWVENGTNFDLYRFDITNQTWDLRVQNTAKADVTLNTAYNRYKSTIENNAVIWEFEYTLNNSSFTATQWSAINSGITSTLVTQIGTNANNISNLSTTKQNTIDSSHKLSADLVDDTNTTNKFVTTTEKNTWNNKQNALPTTSTAGKVLKSTSTAGTVEWGDASSTITSINGLSGGKLTSPLQISGGDSATASKISLDQTASGQITNNATQTIFGFTSNNATNLTVGHSSYGLKLRGSGTRPQFNNNDLALYSDIPTNTNQLTNGAGFITANDLPDTSEFYTKSGGALNAGATITMTGSNPYVGLQETGGTQYYLQGYQGEVGISASGSWTTKRISMDSNGKVFIPSKSIGDGTYTYTLPSKTGTVAMTSDLGTQATFSLSGTTLTITPK